MSGFKFSNRRPKTQEALYQELDWFQKFLFDGPHFVGAPGEIAFQNSWVNFDAGATPPTGTQRHAVFYKMLNRVYLHGVIKTGASGTVAFTLPVGYRPRQSDLAVVAFAGTAPGQVVVNSSGTVVPSNLLAGSNVSAFVFLDNISFPVDA